MTFVSSLTCVSRFFTIFLDSGTVFFFFLNFWTCNFVHFLIAIFTCISLIVLLDSWMDSVRSKFLVWLYSLQFLISFLYTSPWVFWIFNTFFFYICWSKTMKSYLWGGKACEAKGVENGKGRRRERNEELKGYLVKK